MIFCLLLNPTIDILAKITDFKTGMTYKIKQSDIFKFPVGKAISVGLTLVELGENPYIIALIGKNEIQTYAKFLNSRNIQHTLIPIEGDTRSNLTIIDEKNIQSTHLRFPGFSINNHKIILTLEKEIETRIKNEDYVIISGSIPEGITSEDITRLSCCIIKNGGHFILDSNGPILKSLLNMQPYLIKANLEEMGTILNDLLIPSQELKEYPSEKALLDLLNKCQKLNSTDSAYNILTLGKFGSIVFNKDIAVYGLLKLERAPYTVGCGDSYLAGFIKGLILRYSPEECLKLATACGAANTQELGAGVIRKKNVEEFKDLVEIKNL